MRRSLVPILFAKPGWVLPGATLDMDFANNRAWRKGNGLSLPGSLLTTTRASTGYAATSSGLLVPFASNIPRITDLGLLVEEARTNLFLRSDDLSNAAWFAGGQNPTVVSSNNIAPDGTATATRLTIGSGSAAATKQVVSVTNNQPVVIPVYVKAAPSSSATNFRICTNNTGAWNTGGDAVTALTSSWQRITLTYQNSFGTSVAVFFGAQKSDISEDATCRGDVLIWGADFNANNSVPLSHISTTTVAVTRAIDNQAAATALLTTLQSASGTVIMSVGGGIAAAVGTILGINALIGLGKTAADKLTTAFGGAQTSGNTATWTGNNKIGLRWSANAVAICLNGGTIVTAANTPPAVTSANIGSTSGSSAAVNQFIKRLTVVTSSVSDAAFQALCT